MPAKPTDEAMGTVVRGITGLSGPIPATMLRRLRGKDLNSPADILRVMIVLAEDLELVLTKSDQQATEQRLPKVCPGLARPDGRAARA